MAFTAQQIVDKVQILVPGVTDAEALDYVNRAYRWLLGEANIKTEPLEIPAVTLTQAYDLSADLLAVDSVLWVTGVDSVLSRYKGTTLKLQTDPDASRFINLAPGTPYEYFFYNSRQSSAAVADAKAQIWTNPVYNGTPSGGYPKIVIYGTVYRALALGDFVSNAIQFEDALLARAKKLLFEDYDPAQSDYWGSRAIDYLRETLATLARREDDQGQTILPIMSKRRRRAV